VACRGGFVAGVLTIALAAGCSDAPSEELPPPARPAAAAEDPSNDGDVDDEGPRRLLADYGDLLLAAATTGGDALERTLAVTADDRDRFDPACAPRWAHELLRRAEAGDDGSVQVDGDRLRVATITVPAIVHATRVVHRTDAPCGGALPHPERTTMADALAALAAARAAAAAEPVTPTVSASDPARTPTPAPTPTPTATPTSPAWVPPPASPPPARTPTVRVMTAQEFDDELAWWAEVFLDVFDTIVLGETWLGAFGGSEQLAEGYAELAAATDEVAELWADRDVVAGRQEAKDELVLGLQGWRDELLVLAVCVLDDQDPSCASVGELRAAWQAHFARVTELTGIELPQGALDLPTEGLLTPRAPTNPSSGRWNLGDVRVPTVYEVRRSLENDLLAPG
jgi:hypothetical protein